MKEKKLTSRKQQVYNDWLVFNEKFPERSRSQFIKETGCSPGTFYEALKILGGSTKKRSYNRRNKPSLPSVIETVNPAPQQTKAFIIGGSEEFIKSVLREGLAQ